MPDDRNPPRDRRDGQEPDGWESDVQASDVRDPDARDPDARNAGMRLRDMRLRDMRANTQRDVERFQHREPASQFWRSLTLIGSVGWPIVLLATGGALLGRYLDAHWNSGIRCTLLLLTLGTIAGCAIAYRTITSR